MQVSHIKCIWTVLRSSILAHNNNLEQITDDQTVVSKTAIEFIHDFKFLGIRLGEQLSFKYLLTYITKEIATGNYILPMNKKFRIQSVI